MTSHSQNSSSRSTPIVLHPIDLPCFVQWLLDRASPPSTLIICSSSQDFLHDLATFQQHVVNIQQPSTTPELSADDVATPSIYQHPTLTASLANLLVSEHIHLAYCSTRETLSAYLSTASLAGVVEPQPDLPNRLGRQPILALLNPLRLHRDTSQFSAQGLSRTFAAAVECAARNGRRLVFAECGGSGGRTGLRLGSPESLAGNDGEEEVMEGQENSGMQPEDPWEQKVAILNMTTRTFGTGERGWAGRMVEVRRIAERWCTFERVEGYKTQHGHEREETAG